ncbi:GlsB/YeaQ/YmgE family stress response membrane protein [Candidatus Laterigemmans baculatus]|uniref:GlsB/YeaQ/YmgE family stress response membrane protein n=1 Tax=Candidatus Laterigemmans baculatus TaxID=2770505 RepID=UPI001F3B7E41|nr:GlsB/YeaQ/YmgE family stress response membrane protein [Candidatus Laterigemmans baculatus]
MDMLLTLIGWAVFGLIIGAIARLLVPGRQSIGLLATMALGVVGSFVGGFLAYLFFGGSPVQPSNWIGSIIGGVVALLIVVYISRRHGVATH